MSLELLFQVLAAALMVLASVVVFATAFTLSGVNYTERNLLELMTLWLCTLGIYMISIGFNPPALPPVATMLLGLVLAVIALIGWLKRDKLQVLWICNGAILLLVSLALSWIVF